MFFKNQWEKTKKYFDMHEAGQLGPPLIVIAMFVLAWTAAIAVSIIIFR